MILKGNAATLLLWGLLTAVMLAMSGWMHFLGNHAPSKQDARQISLTLQYELEQLQELLHWVAELPSASLDKTTTPIDIRLIVDSSDVRLLHLAPEWEAERQTLLVALVNFINQSHPETDGVMYWRDRAVLVSVQEDAQERRLAGVFLDEWLARLVKATGMEAQMVSGSESELLRQSGHALISLKAIYGDPVFVAAKPILLSEALPFRWTLAVPVSMLASALIVWFMVYLPVWRRLFSLQKQFRAIMHSSTFRDRVQLDGKDEISDLAVQFNSLLSSLEYSYNLIAKTNLVSTELLAKMEPVAVPLVSPLEDEQSLRQTLDMASRLNEALGRDGIELYLQPVYGSDRKTVTGYEALSRWLDSELGMVLPPEYMAVAEKAGLIEPLTRLTLRQTLGLLKKIANTQPEVVISLNLSAAQLFAPGFMQSLFECSESERALFPLLEMEIKESALTRDFDHASVLIGELRGLGIGVCIDDYGLSRYSLMYLQKLPVTSIKLARVFSERISREPREVAFIEGVSRFAGGLGVRVIVKNIENDQQLMSLRADLPVQYQGLALGGLVPAEVI